MIKGIDTASVAGNKNVDWVKAKANAISFAILRGAWGTTKDPFFVKNWALLKRAGIVCGAYLFLRFPYPKKYRSCPSIEAQVEALIDAIEAAGGMEPGDFPPAIDIEFPGEGIREFDPSAKTSAAIQKLAEKALVDSVKAVDLIKAHFGFPPFVYTSARVWLDDLNNLPAPTLSDCPLWLAEYFCKTGSPAVLNPPTTMKWPAVPPPWAGSDPKDRTLSVKRKIMYSSSNSWIHQYQGDALACPGFPTGNVDMNRFNPLYKGMNGERVKWVQRKLGLSANGKFDVTTDISLREFQAAKKTTVDGVIGPKTFAYLACVPAVCSP